MGGEFCTDKAAKVLGPYVHNVTLTQSDREAVEAHLKDCAICRNSLAAIQSLEARLKQAQRKNRVRAISAAKRKTLLRK